MTTAGPRYARLTDFQQAVLEREFEQLVADKQRVKDQLARLQEVVALVAGVGSVLDQDPDGRLRIVKPADD